VTDIHYCSSWEVFSCSVVVDLMHCLLRD